MSPDNEGRSNRDAPPRDFELSAAELAGIVHEAGSRGGSVSFRARGGSMSPFIRDGDTVTVGPLTDADLCVGRIIAFAQPSSGNLVLHRLVGTGSAGCLLKGDNASAPDGIVDRTQLLALVTGVERRGHSVWAGLGFGGRTIAVLSRMGALPVMLALPRKLLALWRWLTRSGRRAGRNRNSE